MLIDYELNLKEGIIYIESTTEEFPPMEVDMHSFFKYIKDKGLNGYCRDWFNPITNSHEQDSGYLNFDEYFDSHHSIIEKDLVTYLKFKKLIK